MIVPGTGVEAPGWLYVMHSALFHFFFHSSLGSCEGFTLFFSLTSGKAWRVRCKYFILLDTWLFLSTLLCHLLCHFFLVS